ncbi:hypothetical protein ACFLWZ_08290 [Chloroflexota bacterium]
MLDIFLVTFMLACFWLCLRYNYPFAVLARSLGALVKLNGALVFPVISLHWLLTRRDRPWHFLNSVALAPISLILLLLLSNHQRVVPHVSPQDEVDIHLIPDAARGALEVRIWWENRMVQSAT